MCKAWDDQLEYGKQIGIQVGEAKGLAYSVRNLTESMQWSMEKAMEVLKVSAEQQADIIKILQSA